jgi:nucleoside-diphosphate-sugar epimerase
MILVTGATGFVGSALVERLAHDGMPVRACVRRADARVPAGVETVRIEGLSAQVDWTGALAGVTAVVHAAARVHVMQDTASDPLAEFRRVNVAGTLRLAEQAAAAGVKRFVFVSSIKVNGEATEPGRPFFADDTPAPIDPYGVSKMEAEQGLREIARATGMEVAIVRPPLVYGPGVKANFRAMMSALRRGLPLPLGAIHNARSLVALGNLVDLIVTCIAHPGAANQTFLVSDGEDLSTTQLLRRMGRALGRPARLIPVPAALLRLGAGALGRGAVAQRLCGSLQVDISKTKELLAWRAPLSVDEGLLKAAEGLVRETSL